MLVLSGCHIISHRVGGLHSGSESHLYDTFNLDCFFGGPISKYNHWLGVRVSTHEWFGGTQTLSPQKTEDFKLNNKALSSYSTFYFSSTFTYSVPFHLK